MNIGQIRERLSSKLKPESERSTQAVKNIVISFGAKGVSILVSLLLVPMTIEYVNPVQYGIWLTLSQIIGWVVYFDLGLGNGFRNRYAQAKAQGDMIRAREYLSTTYFSLICLVSVLFVAFFISNRFIDWPAVLKVDESYAIELRQVFGIVLAFFCLNLIANVFSMLLSADQKPGYSSVILGIGQIVCLAVIWLLIRFTEGSLKNLALYYSGIPCIVMLLASFVAFRFTKYKEIKPGFAYVRFDLIKDILSLGVKFFIICVSMLAIFQVTNIVLSREVGPESVTQYNIAYKYYNVLYAVMLLVITPFWSAFTDAYTKKEFTWMRKSIISLEKAWLVSLLAGVVMLAVSSLFFKIWIGDRVHIPFLLSVGVLGFTLLQILSNIYMYLVNGIGTVRIQLVIYLIFAIVAWPLLTYSCRTFGVAGIIIVPSVTYLMQAIFSKIQLDKIINGKATGWWIK